MKNAFKGDVELWYSNGGDVTHEYLKQFSMEHRAEIFEYLKQLPLNYDVTVNDVKYKLVHASPLDNYYTDPLNKYRYGNEEYFAVWVRWEYYHPIPVGYNLIFGHTPTWHFHDVKPLSIWRDERAAGIDCGCGYHEGRLACLRLDDMKVFYSE